MTATRYDPDEVALLEEERDFLLRSLDDLERERAEGNLDDDDYRRLHDDYTARAAAVIRSLRDGVDARPVAPAPSTRRRVLTVMAVAAFAVVAAVLLTRALGERLPGQTATGNQQIGADKVAAADARLEEGEAAEALRLYDEAAADDPGDAEPRAKSALLVFNAGLVEEALDRLAAAEAADPDYPDTYFFRGIVLLRGLDDTAGARAAFERYLGLAPEGVYAEDARMALDRLDEPAASGEAGDETPGGPTGPPTDEGNP